ncbi:MAG: helix-turn-helix domain-containing protein [Candidatus Bathyarchaeum tardum]|nr:MAG: helix-turn-helix domain-containing protein [Candidatus Bathyarchaeum tardum]
MGLLTDFERKILKLRAKGNSDYAIARALNRDPPTVNRSRKNAEKKIESAKKDIEWVENLTQIESKPINETAMRATF